MGYIHRKHNRGKKHMETIKSLQKRIAELTAAGRSGIVSLLGNAFPPTDDESFWENHDALVYVQPLDTLVAFMSWGSAYQTGDNRLPGDCLLQNFIDREDDLAVEDLGLDEKSYLEICTDCLLNNMAHDESECPKLDCKDYDERYEYPSENGLCFPNSHYTITGAEDIASDIRAIRTAIENQGEISVPVRDGRIRPFCMSINADGQYVLSTFENAEIQDTDTGKNILCQERVQLLRALDWRTFYAKSRLFIYQNWIFKADL